MRLRPGLNFNFTVLELNAMLQELFKYDPQHPEVFSLPGGGSFRCATTPRSIASMQ